MIRLKQVTKRLHACITFIHDTREKVDCPFVRRLFVRRLASREVAVEFPIMASVAGSGYR